MHSVMRNCWRGLSSAAAAGNVSKTVLYDFHVQNKGKMVPFAGWLMPVLYGSHGIIDSHLHTRKQASLFDVSHMLQTRVSGRQAVEFIETAVVGDIAGLAEGRGTLTVMTTDKGTIVDDLIVTRTHEGYLYVVSNAGCRDKDLAHLRSKLNAFKLMHPNSDVQLSVIDTHALVALQGPAAKTVLQAGLKGTVDLSKVGFMHSIEVKQLFGINGDCRLTRCGYTGEDGFEISVPSTQAVALAEQLLKSQAVRLAGLGARDTLRLEAGLCLYGSDIDETTTPVEAGLAWLIGKRRRQLGNFPGSEVILEQLKDASKVKRRRVGLVSREGPPARHDAKVVDTSSGDKVVGRVTSGTVSPSLPKGTNIAMAYVDSGVVTGDKAKAGGKLAVDVRGRSYAVQLAKMPFVATNYYNPSK